MPVGVVDWVSIVVVSSSVLEARQVVSPGAGLAGGSCPAVDDACSSIGVDGAAGTHKDDKKTQEKISVWYS
jgi:hypothetical protein